MACINKDSINDYNFIRWYSLDYTVPVNPLDKLACCEDFDPINRLYQARKELGLFMPFVKQGELFSFFCNAPTVTDGDFPNWQIDLIKKIDVQDNVGTFDFDIVTANVTTLLRYNITLIDYRFYIDPFLFPAVDNGDYQLLIWNNSTNETKYISNPFTVSSNINEFTTLVKWKNSYNSFNFNYEELPNFYNYIRLPLSKKAISYEIEKDEYRSVSTGKVRDTYSENDKVSTFIAYMFDEYAHDAMTSLITQNEVLLNNQKFIPKGSWEVQNTDGSYLANGIGEFIDNRYSTKQKECNFTILTNPFTFTVDTTNTSTGSSAVNEFQLPLISSGNYNFIVDWGDGSNDIITTWDQTETLHSYSIAGIYEVKKFGTIEGFCTFQNGFGVDEDKILSISDYGNLKLINTALGLTGFLYDTSSMAANLSPNGVLTCEVNSLRNFIRKSTVQTIDFTKINCPNVGSLFAFALSALNFNSDISSIVNSTTTSLQSALSASAYNLPVTGWDTPNVTSFNAMFAGNPVFNQNVSGLSIANLTNAAGMLASAISFSTINYDLLLDITTGWPSQTTIQSAVPLGVNNTKYTSGKQITSTTDGITTAFKLIDSTQLFITGSYVVQVGDVIVNTTASPRTIAKVTSVDSETQLTLNNDIMSTGENYFLGNSNAIKGKEKLSSSPYFWVITDDNEV